MFIDDNAQNSKRRILALLVIFAVYGALLLLA
jgi:hypothetical protein